MATEHVAEVVAVFLEEFTLNLPPRQAVHFLTGWQTNTKCGELKALADAEIKMAKLIGLALC